MTRTIESWHAHIYFDAATLERADAICQAAAAALPVERGRMHQRPVGPHPQWSCQLAFKHDTIATVLPWLVLHHEDLTVFIHPNTGDALGDHRDRAIWIGQSDRLDLTALQ